jgi:glycosyltransferase involved in cell wall biosynthesis
VTRLLKLDVVVPAREEPFSTLSECLEGLLADRSSVDLQVVVAANGPGYGQTAAAARRFEAAFEGALRVVEVPEAGKARALAAGERAARGAAIAYLDADVVLLPGTLASMAAALAGDAPCFAAPRRFLLPPRSWITRAYTRVWEDLPAVGPDVGAGCYGVNRAGRGRWAIFPNLLADDAFVRTRFAEHERVVCGEGGALVRMPEGLALVRAVRRWRSGNQQLRAMLGVSADLRGGALRSFLQLVRQPRLWADLPVFILVTAAGRVWPPPRDNAWRTDRPRAAQDLADHQSTG